MPSPRYSQIDIEATPYYHCISRCVRRAFLCGDDRVSGRNFDHRKEWVVEKLAALSELFAIRVCAYALLSNHFHLVVQIDSEAARNWDDDEVVRRHTRLFRSSTDPRAQLTPVAAADRIRRWRARLADLSWYMRCLNEAIARRANDEDDCTGRFWEGRFRSQALLDDAGVLTCMAYVDLNPIRAGIAASLEESHFTSIRQRLAERVAEIGPMPSSPAALRVAGGPARRLALAPFREMGRLLNDRALPVELDDYIDLLTGTGAALCSGNQAHPLPARAARILQAAGIRSEHWLETLLSYHSRFFAMVGSVQHIDIYCARTDRDRARGRPWAARVFLSCA